MIGGQRILILGICVYLCALPVLVAANVCLDGTSDKPTFAPAFGVVMAVGLPGILSAVVYASFGAFHRDRVLSHGAPGERTNNKDACKTETPPKHKQQQ